MNILKSVYANWNTNSLSVSMYNDIIDSKAFCVLTQLKPLKIKQVMQNDVDMHVHRKFTHYSKGSPEVHKYSLIGDCISCSVPIYLYNK